MRSAADVGSICRALKAEPILLNHKVLALVNYDNFVVAPEVLDACSDMVRDVASRYYLRVTRYTTSAFLRSKLGEALLKRGVAPQIFESQEQATLI